MALVLLTNAGGVIFVSLLLVPTQETQHWDTLAHDEGGGAQPLYVYALLLVSCIVGIAIGWAGVNAQAHLTATSFLVVGNVNKFVVIFIGIGFMQEASSWQALLGCAIAISGGVFYALARNRLADLEKARLAAEAKKTEAPAAALKA